MSDKVLQRHLSTFVTYDEKRSSFDRLQGFVGFIFSKIPICKTFEAFLLARLHQFFHASAAEPLSRDSGDRFQVHVSDDPFDISFRIDLPQEAYIISDLGDIFLLGISVCPCLIVNHEYPIFLEDHSIHPEEITPGV